MVAVGHRVATVLPGCRVPGRFAIDGRCDGDRICVWVRGVNRSAATEWRTSQREPVGSWLGGLPSAAGMLPMSWGRCP
jgi:hypothetical protein